MLFNLNKNYWRKHLSKAETKAVLAAFANVAGVGPEDWLGMDKESLFFRQNPHPDSGEWDGLNGVRPKQIRRHIDDHGLEGLEETIRFLSVLPVYDEDRDADWKAAWKKVVQKKGYAGPKIIEKVAEEQEWSDTLRDHVRDPELAALLYAGLLSIRWLETRIEAWREHHRYVPKDGALMVRMEPERFDREAWERHRGAVEAAYGKPFLRLPWRVRENEVVAFKAAIPDEEADEADTLDPRTFEMWSLGHKAAAKNGSEPMTVETAMALAEVLPEGRTPGGELLNAALAKPSGALLVAAKAAEGKTREAIEEMFRRDPEETDRFLANAVRYKGVGFRKAVRAHLDAMRREAPATVEPPRGIDLRIEGVGRVKTVRRSPEIYWLGQMTDCCLHYGHLNGRKILDRYYDHPSARFLLFYGRKGRLAAHVLLWDMEFEGKKALVYDSVETRHDLTGDSRVMRLLRASVAAFYEQGYDLIFCGFDGMYTPAEIFSLGEVLVKKQYRRDPDAWPDRWVPVMKASESLGYSDIPDGLMLFARPEGRTGEGEKDAA